ncbi:glucose dehydrogenase [Actinomycetospora sp. NBRC 106375]|uniref:PQQ-dependent sugar dehydrogenase n=1 Tax=Actinomycetospora sp. NBRC 106375 TaxID=3032207 RepID=UPI0024A090FA|nr:PQQ-dependent sugar dehydrogenase [Actinomycetospora sp. NBRC 106375]GLZ47896.1 glucose dehydrogenase [Actinomycetospora sp. NBRC 106375]
MSGPLRRVALIVALTTFTALLAGCAQFPDAGTQPWRERPDLSAERAPQPELPETGEPTPAPNSAGPSVPPPCVDPDPQVVATCLDPLSAVVTLPGGASALVAERTTGRILRITPDETPEQVATVPVDSAGDGGLMSLALSPSFAEDQLIYAYGTTAAGNAVFRIAPGDVPKVVLGGIPRGASGNRGAIGVEPDGTLLVATGDAGNAAAAAAPTSLAGKLLRIDPFGRPVPGTPNPASPVVGSGLHSPGDVCADPAAGVSWVTDRAGPRDVLLAVRPGVAPGAGAAASPAWTWPERPGVAGCAALPGTLVVGLQGSSAMFVLRPTPQGGFVGAPQAVLQGTYGRITGADVASDGLIWFTTANRGGGGPVTPTDDRVVRIRPPSGGASGAD